ncbi:cytochrome B [Sphingomonas sp. Leaf339]|uniref:cytochrome b n=1 Tax=Sphingomonas sp. Leaf339 TaxID=1736343 RepID=UPI0006FB8508|nr:cytochrome b [Sphingomonas sp. Leaf339]KQU61768.1 cytochrome B [Sphingomonas sp. Leaf339]
MSTHPDTIARYSRVAMWFHWTIAVFVIANLAIGLLHDSVLGFAFPIHKALGITVLALTAARLAWRLAHRAPPLPAHTPAWERGAAHATHWALYLLMIALPVTGWLMVSGSAQRRPLTWFGLFDIPYLPVGKAAGGFGHESHEILGWVMLALVVLHIGAALRHRLILRDHVLARMAPALDR